MPDAHQTHPPQAVGDKGRQWFRTVDCQRYAAAHDHLNGVEGQPRDI
ncbi:MAG: hypothetical protein HOA04_06100 [Euryarchaeota archaeon]|nr:hypothetical protein [Euryarchaeota archaeon]